MKFFSAELSALLAPRKGKQNFKVLVAFGCVFAMLVLVYTAVFELLMAREGRSEDYTLVAGVYWVLTTMSTLGYGEITFQSDLGKAFSMVVLGSGILFLLILLPFSFIEFFFLPWVESRNSQRAPREVSKSLSGHVILTHLDPVTKTLIKRLDRYGIPYAILCEDVEEALSLHDRGFQVVVGDFDSPQTYVRAGVERAAMVATTNTDPKNTIVAFSVREHNEKVPIFATADDAASVDILQLAGCTHVVQLGKMMGQSLARRTVGGAQRAHIVGHFDKLLIAEAPVAGTPLVNQTLKEAKLPALAGVAVVGVWERGIFQSAGPDTLITPHTVLVLAGTQNQMKLFDELFCIYAPEEAPVVIIGAGRVGRATGYAIERRKLPFKIVEQDPARIREPQNYICGNAAELEVLEAAGIMKAPAAVIATHDDAVNVYLAIYLRRLRPDIQIISRSTRTRNVSTLHRAGADFVMSYGSMGASIIFNHLKTSKVVMVAEGLNLVQVKTPADLVGLTLGESDIRKKTGATVVAVSVDGEMLVNPPADHVLTAGGELIVIGDQEAEDEFLARYSSTLTAI